MFHAVPVASRPPPLEIRSCIRLHGDASNVEAEVNGKWPLYGENPGTYSEI